MFTTDEDYQVVVKDSRTLHSASGAYAELTADLDSESLKIYSSDRKLLFQYDPLSGKTSVYVPSGDLEFIAPQGDITFASARGVFLRGQTVQLTGEAGIRISVTDMLGRILSGLTLQSQRAKLSSREVDMTARRGEFQIEEVNWTARKILGRVDHAKLVAGKFERFANTVIEKAKDVYTTVDGAVQLKAGRLRTLLDGTYHFMARKAYLKAREDFKVNAKKIHLG
jgi:hypothetical protein